MPEKFPTIGVEIELPWTNMLAQAGHDTAAKILHNAESGFYELPKEQKTIVQAGFDAVNAKFDTSVQRAVDLGLPTSGNDGYVEFALPPRETTEQAARDVAALYELELLNPAQVYPLHLTIGGIGLNAAAAYLLCSTEVAGDISSDRVTQKNTWNVKGRGGAKPRFAHELQLDMTRGVEFRTLQLTSLEQFSRMTTTAQIGAYGIATEHPAWKKWRSMLHAELTQAELPTNDYWGRFDATTWQKYGELIAQDDWRLGIQRQIGKYTAEIMGATRQAS